MLNLKRRFEILLLAAVPLALFYPMIFAGENSIDDMTMIQDQVTGELDLFKLFKPSGGFYYRPLLMLTFWADKFLWDQDLGFMHLENILLHTLNAILVYWVARAMAHHLRVEHRLFPLLSGLIFAVHPITTESVNWVSGRTDLLATCFVLLTTLAILRSTLKASLSWAFAGSLLFIAAVMSKEMSLFFFPCAIVLFWWYGKAARFSLKATLCFSSPFVLAGLVYVTTRMLTVSSHQAGVSDLLQKWHYGIYDTARVSFKVFGFYVKKLFVPVPLNFAIREVAEGYVVVGLAVLMLSLFLLYKKNLLFRPYALGFFLILPAILLALTSIAWTPVAERYIYLPAAFTVIGLSACLLSIRHRFPAWAGFVALAALLVSASAVTAHRVYLWQDNLRLFADAKEKGPDFSAVDNELGAALMKSGDTVGAEKVLLAAIEKDEGNPLLYLTLAHVYQTDGQYDKFDGIVDAYIAKNGYVNIAVLTGFSRILERKLLEHKMDDEDERINLEKLVVIYRNIYRLSSDPFTLYRIAQLELGLGNRRVAAETFAMVVEKAPNDAYYKPAAEKLAARLQQHGHE